MAEEALLFEVDVKSLAFDEALSDRTPQELKDVSALAANMKAMGQISPIVVEKDGDKFKVIAGKRRTVAAKIIGMKTLRAVLYPNESNKTLAMLSDNVLHKRTDSVMQAKVLKALLDAKAFKNQTEIAAAMGTAQSTVSKLLALLDESEEVQAAVAEKALPAYVAAAERAKKKKDQKEGKKGKVKTLDEVKTEHEARKFRKLPAEALMASDGVKVDFDIWVSEDRVRVAFVLPLKKLNKGLEAAITDEINKVGDQAVTASIKRFRKQAEF